MSNAPTITCIIIVIFLFLTHTRNIVWQDEIGLWQDVVRKSPEIVRGHNELGVAFLNHNMLDNAFEEFQKAAQLDPLDPDYYYNIGTIYGKKGFTDKAIDNYRIAINLKPDYIKAHFNIGLIYLRKGLLDDASKEFEVILGLDPEDYQARAFFTYSLQRKRSPD